MLKRMSAEDFEDYMALSREFYSSKATDHPVSDDHPRRTFEETVGGSPLARGWLIRDGQSGRAVGYMLASLTWSNEFGGRVAWLEELYLRPETRGQGLGRRVLETVIAELKERDRVAGFRLEVAPANEEVGILYEKMGFSRAPYQQWWMTA